MTRCKHCGVEIEIRTDLLNLWFRKDSITLGNHWCDTEHPYISTTHEPEPESKTVDRILESYE